MFTKKINRRFSEFKEISLLIIYILWEQFTYFIIIINQPMIVESNYRKYSYTNI